MEGSRLLSITRLPFITLCCDGFKQVCLICMSLGLLRCFGKAVHQLALGLVFCCKAHQDPFPSPPYPSLI